MSRMTTVEVLRSEYAADARGAVDASLAADDPPLPPLIWRLSSNGADYASV